VSAIAEDPPLPPILFECPVLLLHVELPPRRTALAHSALILGHVTIVPALDNLPPRLVAVRPQPPHREHQLAAGHPVLQSRARRSRSGRAVRSRPSQYSRSKAT
jgi:hypothetical protein